jgi:hypothetical protein
VRYVLNINSLYRNVKGVSFIYLGCKISGVKYKIPFAEMQGDFFCAYKLASTIVSLQSKKEALIAKFSPKMLP